MAEYSKSPRSRLYDRWWEAFNAIPPSATCKAYYRLRHLWIDPTRVRKEGGERVHEFYNQARETHLTAVLWENFEPLDSRVWLPALASTAGLRYVPPRVTACSWSYGWVREKPRRKILDIVVHYRGQDGLDGVIVVEVKNMGCGLARVKISIQVTISTFRNCSSTIEDLRCTSSTRLS